ncbi:MAG TPA: hypothetical protein VIM12_03635 [Noviherbaspirillum sp.]|uniref:hypothetical protein n=1 Tax=Noviherbaspirillum sp. TaxID=1926288 RepID=UPI002F9360ED
MTYYLPVAESPDCVALRNACAGTGLEISNRPHMQRRLQSVLFPEAWIVSPGENVADSAHYQRSHKAITDTFTDEECRAITKWTDVENAYTADLNTALSHYTATGQKTWIQDPDNMELGLDVLVEERMLTGVLAKLPQCRSRTLRIAHVTDPQFTDVYPGKIYPGQLASNYPRFMSTSGHRIQNDDVLDAFDGSKDENAVVYEFIATSGKPLGEELNEADAEEKEFLFHPSCVFMLAATAKAVPAQDGASTRVAAIYVEVAGHDARQVRNLYTGEFPPRR